MTEQIWRELSDRLRRFVRSRIASESDVDDVLQTVFLRIHSRFAELRQVDRLESWVFQIARNAVIDHFRRQRDTLSDVESVVVESEDSAVDDINDELSNCLGALIQRLPEDQRRALSLYELEGISQKEIAERESITVSGAKSRVQRGRKSLEEMLKACCEFQLDRRGNVLEYEPTDPNCCDEHCR
jgi:RNA polymerase sigma-70 factor (ECF subfamily)